MFNLLSCCRKSFLEVYLYPPTPEKSTYHSISDDHLCLLITQLLIIQSIKSTHEHSFELLHTLKPIWRKIQFWSYHQLNKQKIQYLNLTKKPTESRSQEHTAATKPQLATGPQKWVVFGPTGLFKNARNEAMYDQTLLQIALKQSKILKKSTTHHW